MTVVSNEQDGFSAMHLTEKFAGLLALNGVIGADAHAPLKAQLHIDIDIPEDKTVLAERLETAARILSQAIGSDLVMPSPMPMPRGIFAAVANINGFSVRGIEARLAGPLVDRVLLRFDVRTA